MKTAIYTRVSTDKQSHDSQLVELRGYCERRGWRDVAEYGDRISGAKFTREGLDRLIMSDVRRRTAGDSRLLQAGPAGPQPGASGADCGGACLTQRRPDLHEPGH